jgi:hypothetical protein
MDPTVIAYIVGGVAILLKLFGVPQSVIDMWKAISRKIWPDAPITAKAEGGVAPLIQLYEELEAKCAEYGTTLNEFAPKAADLMKVCKKKKDE